MLLKMSKDKMTSTLNQVHTLCSQQIPAQHLVNPKEVLKLQKYDQYIPINLLHKAYALDHLNPQELEKAVPNWRSKI